ncbi:MAG: hypothetical protein AAGC56_14115 [Pseudomonadota bacterium]
MTFWLIVAAACLIGGAALAHPFLAAGPAGSGARARLVGAAAAAAIPLAGLGVYAAVGAPDFERIDAPVAGDPAQLDPEQRRAAIVGMVSGLEARLAEAPDDLDGWMMLGRSFAVLGEPDKSVDAYARAASLAPDDAGVVAAFARALLQRDPVGEGPLAPNVAEAFERLLALSPADPLALYVAGRAARDRGEIDLARERWAALLARMPEDRPERARLQGEIDALAP